MLNSKRCTGFTRNIEESFDVLRSKREYFAHFGSYNLAAGTNNEAVMLAEVMIHH